MQPELTIYFYNQATFYCLEYCQRYSKSFIMSGLEQVLVEQVWRLQKILVLFFWVSIGSRCLPKAKLDSGNIFLKCRLCHIKKLKILVGFSVFLLSMNAWVYFLNYWNPYLLGKPNHFSNHFTNFSMTKQSNIISEWLNLFTILIINLFHFGFNRQAVQND